MGKGFSLKGRTGVKECLAFQTPNPPPAVWIPGLRCSEYTLCSVSVVVIDLIKKSRNKRMLSDYSSFRPYVEKARVLGALSAPFPDLPLSLAGHRVYLMLRHWSVGDVGNLSGQPNPPLFMLVCQQASKHVYAPGDFSGSLSDYVARPGRSQTSRSQWLRGALTQAASRRASEGGASSSQKSEPHNNGVVFVPPASSKQYMCRCSIQYTMECIPPPAEPVDIYTVHLITHSKHE